MPHRKFIIFRSGGKDMQKYLDETNMVRNYAKRVNCKLNLLIGPITNCTDSLQLTYLDLYLSQTLIK